MNPNTNNDAGAGADPATAGAAAGEGTSLFAGIAPGNAGAAATGDDWLPEKFRVTGADGSLDEAASARKLAASYAELEKHRGAVPVVPESPDGYTLDGLKNAKGEALDAETIAAFVADPLFQEFAKEMHGAKLTNEQLNLVVSRYLDIAPKLIAADQQQTVEEAKAELAKVWTDDAAMQRNLQGALRAIDAYGAEADDVPGSRARLHANLGKNPDFVAYAARVSQELSEDKGVRPTAVASDVDVEALQKSEAYWKPEHPDHARIKAQVSEYYARKFGTTAR